MFNGFLLKVGNYTVPPSLMKLESYNVSQLGQDLDSYRDSNGVLHRNALTSKVVKVEFETKDMLTNLEFSQLMANIRNQYTNATEKKLLMTAYVPELDGYVTQTAYVPDITPSIYNIDVSRNIIHIRSTRIAFIGYGD